MTEAFGNSRSKCLEWLREDAEILNSAEEKKEQTLSEEIEREIEDISMQVEELSARSGGMLYIDILRKIAENLDIPLNLKSE